MLRKLLLCFATLVVAGPAVADDATSCFRETGDVAIAACTGAISSGAGRPSINYYNRGYAYYNKGDMDLAIADYTEAIRLDAKSAFRYTARGNAYYQKGDDDRAIADYNEAVRLDTKYAPAYNGRANVYGVRGEIDRAIADYNEAIRLDPKFADPYDGRGNAYRNKGDNDRAIADYNEAIRLNPTFVFAYNNRGIFYRDNGDNDRAIADYNEAIRLKPKNAALYVNRGLVYEKLADASKARADFNTALGLAQQGDRWPQDKARERLAAMSSPPSATATPKKSDVATDNIASTAQALNKDHRIALVIGNSAYENVAALPNPERDANLVADVLKRTGFESVTLVTNLRKDALIGALRNFATRAEKADWAVVYYAGHGMEVGGINYLIPTDEKISADRDIGFEAVPLEQVLNAAERAKKLRLVILDACRDNPFANQMKRTLTVASRSVSRGLAAVEPEAGTLVVYAAKDGETALDGDGINSPFASAFVKNLSTPGLEVRRLFDFVRDDVMEATGRKQKPFSYGSISGRQDFYFVSAPATSTSPSENAPSATAPLTFVERGFWGENVAPKAPLSATNNMPSVPRLDSEDGHHRQRVVLYDENPSDPKGKQYVGSVIWRTEQIKAFGTQKTDIAVRADIDIPDRKFKMTMSFRRNTDTSLPASHTAELTFTLPRDFSGGGIGNVPGILMKSNEQARGTPLAGLAVKVTDGFFLVGLSNVDVDRQRNLQLLKDRWFDVPLVYANQRRAIIAIEKGAPGERAFNEAFAAW